jgi:S1-C subfamily serine protease
MALGYKAGLQSGDIIIKLGSVQINNIYDYVTVLGKFKANAISCSPND